MSYVTPRVALVCVLLLLWGRGSWGRDLSWVLDAEVGTSGRGGREVADPVDLALLKDGGLAVLDRGREAVVIFSSSGRYERTLGGKRGEGDLSLKRPSAIAVDGDERLWIVDQGNHRLVVIDLAGAVQGVHGGLGGLDGRFRYPSHLAIGPRGQIFVADSGNERIQVLRADGTFVASWDRRTGGRRSYLGKPVWLAYTDEGRGGVWVLSEGETLLQRFDLEGRWEETLQIPEGIDGDVKPVAFLVENEFHRMILVDGGNARMIGLDRKGRLVGMVGGGAEEAWDLRGVVADRRLGLYVAEGNQGRVLYFLRK